MMKALSVRICRVCSSLCRSSARVMAESSALLTVCRSSWDFIFYVDGDSRVGVYNRCS